MSQFSLGTVLKAFQHHLLEGKFGLEKENVRVTPAGTLAVTPHPAVFGDKGSHPYITTDFSESQIEMITPPLPSVAQAIGFMETIHDIVTENIGDELLWPQSLPPPIREDQDIPISHFTEALKDKELYRERLAKIYGKERQLISGIHFNFSLPEELRSAVIEDGSCGDTMKQVRETLYFKMVRNFLRYRWLYIWLYGESPLAEESLKVLSLKTGLKQPLKCGVSLSLRNSPLGYRNTEELFIDYSSLQSYNESIQRLIAAGQITGPQELYLPVRVKFLKEDDNAPSYLEVRIVDLDPFSKSGVCSHAIYFAHMLLVYSLLKDEPGSLSEEEMREATCLHDTVSCYGRNDEHQLECCHIKARNGVRSALEDMLTLFKDYNLLTEEYRKEMEYTLNLVNNPEKRIGMLLYEAIKKDGFKNFHLKQAMKFKEMSHADAYKFHGFGSLEMSTQLLLRAAVLRGVLFEIVDSSENFICLRKGDKEEYVVQATKTSLDNYVSILIMENKTVTKRVLSNGGITVPSGREYSNSERAISDYHLFKDVPVVVKPKSTNFGLGITILKHQHSQSDFIKAVNMAFEHDTTILVEKFVSGREYRMIVLNGEAVGILHRVPANVTGDGHSTIAELIDKKNQDPLRGKGYHTPLEQIAKGQAELLFLQQQHKDFNTVPQDGEVVYLRENSNVSTGGDTLDYTDEVHDSYKRIAVMAAALVNVKITGIDMIIKDIHAPATSENYAIIEMNFNPAIHIHCHPMRGQARKINHKILDALGF